MEWAIFGGAWVLAIILLGIIGDGIRQKRKLAVQEMLQKERLAAMDKGLPLPEWDADMLDDGGGPMASEEVHARRLQWLRFITLCLGLVLIFGGFGFMFAFELSDMREFQRLTSLGVVPVFTGAGLLLFSYLSRKMRF